MRGGLAHRAGAELDRRTSGWVPAACAGDWPGKSRAGVRVARVVRAARAAASGGSGPDRSNRRDRVLRQLRRRVATVCRRTPPHSAPRRQPSSAATAAAGGGSSASPQSPGLCAVRSEHGMAATPLRPPLGGGAGRGAGGGAGRRSGGRPRAVECVTAMPRTRLPFAAARRGARSVFAAAAVASIRVWEIFRILPGWAHGGMQRPGLLLVRGGMTHLNHPDGVVVVGVWGRAAGAGNGGCRAERSGVTWTWRRAKGRGGTAFREGE